MVLLIPLQLMLIDHFVNGLKGGLKFLVRLKVVGKLQQLA